MSSNQRAQRGFLRHSLFWFLLAIPPIVFLWWIKTQAEPRPSWVHYYDPEAIYFFEGLDLARLRPPASFDRPGAQVQLLSALVAISRGSTALDFDGFRQSVYVVTLVLVVSGVALLFWRVFDGLPGPAALAGAWTYFACPQSLEYFAVWSPEALYLPIGAVALACLAHAERADLRSGALFVAGLGVGSLCALKLTFLPWVVGLVVATLATPVPGSRGRISRTATALGGVLLAFAGWTIYMLPRFGDLLTWVWRLLSRDGEYGAGTAGLPALAVAFTNLRDLLLAAKGWYLFLALLVVFVGVGLAREVRTTGARPGTRWLATFVLVSLLVGLAFGARQPVGRYYLATGLLAILLLRIGAQVAARAKLGRLAGTLALGVVTLLAAKQALLDLEVHRSRIASESELRRRLEAAVAGESGEPSGQPVVWGFRAPIPSLALHVMARSEEDHAEIYRAFPREGFVDWSGNLRLPPGEREWRWLALQRNEAPDADAVCARALEVDRFVLYEWEGCGPRLPKLPEVALRGRSPSPGVVR